MTDLEPCDEAFFDTAPVRFVDAMELAAPAEQVWAGLTADRPLSWCRAITSARWTSPRPFGVGTTRSVKVAGLLRLRERYFRWEEGTRMSFSVESTNLPAFRRFGEDYLVEPFSETRSRFTWVIAWEPLPLGRLGTPVNGLLMRSLFSDTRRHFGT
ncbi:MAG: SRPBCC family protein [Micromonosporaceae bacterium]